jgi:hypothetical protein
MADDATSMDTTAEASEEIAIASSSSTVTKESKQAAARADIQIRFKQYD